MGVMLLHGPAGNQYVVHIGKDKVQACQDPVQESLKALASIPKTKRHANELEKTKRSNHRCFWNILRANRHLVITLPQVNLGEDGAAGKTSSQVRYVGTGVVVGLGLKVEAPRMATTTRLFSSPYEVVKPSCSLIS